MLVDLSGHKFGRLTKKKQLLNLPPVKRLLQALYDLMRPLIDQAFIESTTELRDELEKCEDRMRNLLDENSELGARIDTLSMSTKRLMAVVSDLLDERRQLHQKIEESSKEMHDVPLSEEIADAINEEYEAMNQTTKNIQNIVDSMGRKLDSSISDSTRREGEIVKLMKASVVDLREKANDIAYASGLSYKDAETMSNLAVALVVKPMEKALLNEPPRTSSSKGRKWTESLDRYEEEEEKDFIF